MTIEEAASKLRSREISAVELTNEALRRIRALQPVLNAFITITEDLALQQAQAADAELARGIDRGPLHGIPYALKDLFETRGIRTTSGSRILADYIPARDCSAFEKLSEAGAVLMGKTGMHEFAYGITNHNPHYGPVRNPRDTSRISGGSSGGSGAAVAGDMVFFAMGTDTGGSIRIPAAYCGCAGLKPTFGRISRFGVLPLAHTLDHAGPMTRSVRDAALVMNAVAGFDRRDDSSSRQPVPDHRPPADHSIHGLRVGVPANFFADLLSPPVRTAWETSLRRAERLGARLIEVTVPDPAAVNVIGRMILLAEATAQMQPWLGRRNDFGADVRALLDQGRLIPAADYINAQKLRRLYQKRWAGLWQNVDVVFTPSISIEAPLVAQEKVDLSGREEDVRLASTRLVRPFNVLGLPAITIPAESANLPIGLQIVGPPFAEPSVLAVAAVLER